MHSLHDLLIEYECAKERFKYDLFRAFFVPGLVIVVMAIAWALADGDYQGPEWILLARNWINVIAAFGLAFGIVLFGRKAIGNYQLMRALKRQIVSRKTQRQ